MKSKQIRDLVFQNIHQKGGLYIPGKTSQSVEDVLEFFECLVYEEIKVILNSDEVSYAFKSITKYWGEGALYSLTSKASWAHLEEIRKVLSLPIQTLESEAYTKYKNSPLYQSYSCDIVLKACKETIDRDPTFKEAVFTLIDKVCRFIIDSFVEVLRGLPDLKYLPFEYTFDNCFN